jgi:hypothetical protein
MSYGNLPRQVFVGPLIRHPQSPITLLAGVVICQLKLESVVYQELHIHAIAIIIYLRLRDTVKILVVERISTVLILVPMVVFL